MSTASRLQYQRITLICLTTAAWAFAFGVGTQGMTLAMNSMGWSDSVIGWNTGTYYLGIAIAAIFVPVIMEFCGARSAVLGMILCGVCVWIFPWNNTSLTWFSLRFLCGMASALSLVPLETYVSQISPNGHRSKTFAIYATALTSGGALGLGIGMPLYHWHPWCPFYLSGLISCLAGFALQWGLPEMPVEATDSNEMQVDLPSRWLSFGSGWYQGFLEGGMLAFLSLYLLHLGLQHERAGFVVGISLLGVILFQYPVGWMADRFGRIALMLSCYTIIGLGLCLLPYCQSDFAVISWLFLVGACSGALYPLGLAILSDRVSKGSLAQAYAWFMAMECIGSVMGPISIGRGRDLFGETAMFPIGAIGMLLVLIPWFLLILFRRRTATPTTLPHPQESRQAA